MSRNNSPVSASDIEQYINASGESSHIDAKGPIKWDGEAKSAALAKAIAAFANSRDGGVLVIGKSETAPGQFELTGLTDDQANSFDTTKVAKWINNKFAPPIEVICHQHCYKGNRFVVITVVEFKDVPILCTKSYQNPENTKKHIIRERTIYVRNSNAESAPLGSVEELRELIGLATSKRGNEMLKMFESMLKGKPLVALPNDEEQFDDELNRIEEGIGKTYVEQMTAGAWRLVVRPTRYDVERWTNADHLEDIIRRRSVRLSHSVFPASQTGTHMREWGICNDAYGETWTLAQSGQFLCIRPYWENKEQYKAPWVSSPPTPELAAGRWLDFKSNFRSIVEMFMFSVRLVEEYEPGEEVQIALQATTLAGRRLVTTDSSIWLQEYDDGKCRAEAFEFKRSCPVEEFRVQWKAFCAEAMKCFDDYFPGPRDSLETMAHWIENFESRRF